MYQIPTNRIVDLAKKLDALVRHAHKLGLDGVAYTLGAPAEVGYVKQYPVGLVRATASQTPDCYRSFTPVEVTGPTLVVAGWTLVAALDHFKDEETGESVNLLRGVPGVAAQLPAEFRDSSALRCDHCGKAIRRATTYVLRSEVCGYKQVGSTCLRDFLGGQSAQALVAAFELDQDLRLACSDEDGEGGGGRDEQLDPILVWLGYVAAAIRIDGWLSRGKARDLNRPATADLAGRALHPFKDKAWARERHPTAEDTALAQATLNYVRGEFGARDPASLNDYEHNLLLACRMSGVGQKTGGIVASAVACYQREQVKRQQVANLAGSKHVGAVGDKIHVWGALYSEPRSFAGDFGASWLVKVVTDNGDVLTTFASRKPEAAVNERLLWGGIVKGHGEYKGVKETKVSRFGPYSAEGAAQWLETEARKAAKAAKKAAKTVYDATPEGQAKLAKKAAKAAKLAASIGPVEDDAEVKAAVEQAAIDAWTR